MDKVVLNEMQILQLKRFIRLKGIKEEDVIHEILDHFACKTEELMTENILLPFDKASEEAFYSFGYNGFRQMSSQYEKRMQRMVWGEFKKALQEVLQTRFIIVSTIWCIAIVIFTYYLNIHPTYNWLDEWMIYVSGISMLVFFGFRFYSTLIAHDGLADLSFDKNIKMWEKKVIKMPKIDQLNLLLMFFLFIFKLSASYYVSIWMLMGYSGLLNSLARKETMKRMTWKLQNNDKDDDYFNPTSTGNFKGFYQQKRY